MRLNISLPSIYPVIDGDSYTPRYVDKKKTCALIHGIRCCCCLVSDSSPNKTIFPYLTINCFFFCYHFRVVDDNFPLPKYLQFIVLCPSIAFIFISYFYFYYLLLSRSKSKQNSWISGIGHTTQLKHQLNWTLLFRFRDVLATDTFKYLRYKEYMNNNDKIENDGHDKKWMRTQTN